MLIQDFPAPVRDRWPVRWAVASGVAGVVANVLLVLFFVLARPFSGIQNGFGWLGTANDCVIIVQFLTMIGVALALSRWLPPIRSVRTATALAVGSMLAVAGLQVLLVAGVLSFDVQVLLVSAAFLPVYAWVLVVSSVGHRRGVLPRPVTRFGLLLGMSFPAAVLLVAVALLVGGDSSRQLLLALPGGVLGGLSWLALPLWPLVLGRLVFSRPTKLIIDEGGAE